MPKNTHFAHDSFHSVTCEPALYKGQSKTMYEDTYNCSTYRYIAVKGGIIHKNDYFQETINRRLLHHLHGAEYDAWRETNHKRKNDAKSDANDPKNAARFTTLATPQGDRGRRWGSQGDPQTEFARN